MFADRLKRTLRDRAVPALIIGALILVAIGAASSLLGAPNSTSVYPATASASASSVGTLYVHVVGAVRVPGIVSVPVGSRVFDAVAAAGGFAEDADRTAVNLAREIRNGEQLVLLRFGEAPNVGGGSASVTGGLINLNTAPQSALESLPHVGPALAARIIDYRTEHGSFGSVGELSEVPGIGAKRLAELTPLVTV